MVECSGDNERQNRFYNGWTYGHYIGGLLVFYPMVPFPSVVTMCRAQPIIVRLQPSEKYMTSYRIFTIELEQMHC